MTKPKTLWRLEVLALLRKEVAAVGSMRAYARQHGYTVAYLSDVLRGRRDPGPKVLTPLGLVRDTPAEQNYSYRKTGKAK